MQCGKDTQRISMLLIKRSTLRSRINGYGDDWDHYNDYLMVSTAVFVGFSFNNACTMGACLRGQSSFLAYAFSGLAHY